MRARGLDELLAERLVGPERLADEAGKWAVRLAAALTLDRLPPLNSFRSIAVAIAIG